MLSKIFCLVWITLMSETNFWTVQGDEVIVIVGPGLTFDPKHQEINVGDTLVFKWAYPDSGRPDPSVTMSNGKVPHTVTRSVSFEEKCKYVDEEEKKKRKLFNSGYKESGDVFKQKFTKVENVTYHCETTGITCTNCQGGMWGTVNVVAEGANVKKPSRKYKMEADGPTNAQAEQAGTVGRKHSTAALGGDFDF